MAINVCSEVTVTFDHHIQVMYPRVDVYAKLEENVLQVLFRYRVYNN